MATCKDCVHVDVCEDFTKAKLSPKRAEEVLPVLREHGRTCEHFKGRSRFVELPCKVGDTAWILERYKNGDGYFYTGIVTGVHVTDRKTIYKLPYKRFNYIVIRFVQTDSLKHINFNEIGKTVFFTKEAAEQALKEREK